MFEDLSTCHIYAMGNDAYLLALFGLLAVVGPVVVKVHKDEIADWPSADESRKEGVPFLSLDNKG